MLAAACLFLLSLLAELQARAWASPYTQKNVVIYPSEKFWSSRDRTSARTTGISM